MGEEVDGSEVSCCSDEVFAVDGDFGDVLSECVDLVGGAVFVGGGDAGVGYEYAVVVSLYPYNGRHGYKGFVNVEGTARRLLMASQAVCFCC